MVGSYVRKSAIYILVRKDKSNYQSLLELREIVVPINPEIPVKMNLLEDDVVRTWHSIVKKDMLVMIDLSQNLMRIYKLGSQPAKAGERKVYLKPASGSGDEKFNDFYQIISKIHCIIS